MEIVRGYVAHGESFVMDDENLIDCTFVDCTIEYSGGPVIMERTAMRGCRYLFSGRAKRTLEFLDCVGLLPLSISGWKEEDCLVH